MSNVLKYITCPGTKNQRKKEEKKSDGRRRRKKMKRGQVFCTGKRDDGVVGKKKQL